MEIYLHKNATTTPARRKFIQNNPDMTLAELAEILGVSKTTIRRWRMRSDTMDRPTIPNNTKKLFAPEDEIGIVLCRLATRAGLDDLHKIIASFFGIDCSRASLNRCLKRYHISRLPSLNRKVPFDLNDYTGTYFYYTCFKIPALFGTDTSVCLHTILDCSFRIFDAEFSAIDAQFLSRQIRRFPLKVLGVIYQDPIVLGPDEETGMGDRLRMTLEDQCRPQNMIAHHITSQYPETIEQLKQTCSLIKNSENRHTRLSQWPSSTEFAKRINWYNTQFYMDALRQKTPHQALNSHYAHFPNSFRQRPQISDPRLSA